MKLTLNTAALDALFDYEEKAPEPEPKPEPKPPVKARKKPVKRAPAPPPPPVFTATRRLPRAPEAAPTPAPAPPPPAPPRPKPGPTKGKLRTTVPLEALAALVDYGRIEEKPAPPPVVVVKAPPRPVPVDDTRTSPMPPEEVIRNFDWDRVDLDATAIRLRDLMKDGVPQAIRYTYKDEVLALFGLDINLMEGCLRQPERVEIRPESFDKDKRYPVLGFHRGDISVILGLRQPVTPKVIAAYASSRLQHDTHRVGHAGAGGGGNRHGNKGLPSNPRQVVTQLRARGAKVELNPLQEGQPVEVFYQGKSMGKISTGTVPRATAEADYQRTLRRMTALDAKV